VSQLRLLNDGPLPPAPAGIDLRHCDARELLEDPDVGEACLVIADPPWSYTQGPGAVDPSLQYSTLSDQDIAEIMQRAGGAVACDARLAMWCTWPKLGEWWAAWDRTRSPRWQYVTGGAWNKTDLGGVGYHWLGRSEPVLIYKRGAPCATKWGGLTNSHISRALGHSEKPAEWIVGWLERWTEPGDLVVDLFAGLAPVAVACLRTGRRYLGAELNGERHRAGSVRIAREQWKE